MLKKRSMKCSNKGPLSQGPVAFGRPAALTGFAVLLPVAVFTVAGCKTDSEPGNPVLKLTQTAEQKAANKFTLTVSGGMWAKDIEKTGSTVVG
jgi:hypothetical protein